jgi:bacillithiol system protein YtxJ
MINWKTLDNKTNLTEIIEQSIEEPVAIFKHSISCPISSMAKRRLESSWPSNIDIYYLDLINYRSISNDLSKQLGIQHESPQLLLIHEGQVKYHGSHLNIDVNAVNQYVDRISKEA